MQTEPGPLPQPDGHSQLLLCDSSWADTNEVNTYIFNTCSVQFNSVAQSCPTLCDPMNCSTPGLPVHHQFLEFTQTHVHQVGDAIQPSHPLPSPSPPTPSPSQHQGIFQWVNSSLELPKYWSFSFSIIPSKEHPGLISFRVDWLDLLTIPEIKYETFCC